MSTTVNVQVPVGVSPGERITISVQGALYAVQVPRDKGPGGTFSVTVDTAKGSAGGGLQRTASGRLVSPAHAPHLAELARTNSQNDRLRAELPEVRDRIHLVPQLLTCDRFDRPKQVGAQFNLGLLGMAPFRKRPDLAVDILEALRRHDSRYSSYRFPFSLLLICFGFVLHKLPLAMLENEALHHCQRCKRVILFQVGVGNFVHFRLQHLRIRRRS